jgi:hypothetical protein
MAGNEVSETYHFRHPSNTLSHSDIRLFQPDLLRTGVTHVRLNETVFPCHQHGLPYPMAGKCKT